jgi:hypothetical protein
MTATYATEAGRKTWDAMTDAERDQRNVEAWDACCSRLRDALRDAEDRGEAIDLDEAKARVEARIAVEMTENTRLVRRGQRTRATRSDRDSAQWAAHRNADLGLDLGMLWDVEL